MAIIKMKKLTLQDSSGRELIIDVDGVDKQKSIDNTIFFVSKAENKIKEEIENEKKKQLQFNNKYSIPLKDFSKCDADVKYNEAAILKEEYLLDKKNKEEEAALNKILIEKKDSKEFDRWKMEMEIKDEMDRLEQIEKRKLTNELNREYVNNYYQHRMQKNQLMVAEHKKQELLNKEIKDMEKKEELNNKKKVIKEIQQSQENAQIIKAKNQEKNKEIPPIGIYNADMIFTIDYKNRKKVYETKNNKVAFDSTYNSKDSKKAKTESEKIIKNNINIVQDQLDYYNQTSNFFL